MACALGAATASAQGHLLVLGDSVPFAFINSAGYEYGNAGNFIGYADDLAATLQLDVVDAACPGETTGSFLSATAPDNGCRAYRAKFPLHVGYSSTQASYAIHYLEGHDDVRLITIMLGANDGFLLEDSCASQPDPAACIEAGVPALLTSVASNLARTLSELRATGYAGAIVLVNYYSVDYSDPAGTGLTALLNRAIAEPAAAYGADVANVFAAFQNAAENPRFGGKTCNAGLLNASVADELLCDVHPAQSGHRLIAQAIASTYRRH